jgi:polysaccharide biosynthesis transport protein
MMTPLEILRLVRRWWWVLVLCPLVAASVAYFVSSASTPLYRASSTIVIEVPGTSGSSGYQSLLESERRTQTYSTLIETRSVLESTANRIGVPLTPNQLRERIVVSQVRDTQLLRIAVTDASPARASAIANTVSEVFIEQQRAREQDVTNASDAVLADEIKEVRDEITTTSAQLDEYNARPDAETEAIQATINSLENELNQYESLYSTLLDKRVQSDLTDETQITRLWIAEGATPPSHAVSPRIRLNTAMGGVVGFILAAGLVTLFGYLDNTVKTSDDVRRLTNSSAVGTIPLTRSKEGLEPLQFPRSPATEAYRALRTNLQFASLGRDVRSLVVTSPSPGDGKTTTIGNLGTVLAQGGQNVIIIDADLRKPRLHKLFSSLTNRVGLTNLLLADADVDLDTLLQLTSVPNLRILTTGPLPPNPADVLNSPRMRDAISQLCGAADIVLIDAPPMAVSDALIIASLVDGVMLVTTGGRTRSNELVTVVESLARSGTKLAGVVINRAQFEGESYYYQSYYNAHSDPPPMSGSGDDGPASNRERKRFPTPFGRHSAETEPGGGSSGS